MMASLSIAELAKVILPRELDDGLILMLSGYFDDSGTHADSSVVVVGGFIGNETQWTALEKAWRDKLRRPFEGFPPLKMFHLSQCRARDGEFLRYHEADIAALTYDFRQIIIEAGLYGIAFAIDRKAWDELVASPLRTWLGDPEERCLRFCVARSIAFARQNNSQIAFVFDGGRERARLHRLISAYEKWHGIVPELASITFGNVQKLMPLQAADILATELYWFAKDWFADPHKATVRAHFADYLKKGMCELNFIDRGTIKDRIAKGKFFISFDQNGEEFMEQPTIPFRHSTS